MSDDYELAQVPEQYHPDEPHRTHDVPEAFQTRIVTRPQRPLAPPAEMPISTPAISDALPTPETPANQTADTGSADRTDLDQARQQIRQAGDEQARRIEAAQKEHERTLGACDDAVDAVYYDSLVRLAKEAAQKKLEACDDAVDAVCSPHYDSLLQLADEASHNNGFAVKKKEKIDGSIECELRWQPAGHKGTSKMRYEIGTDGKSAITEYNYKERQFHIAPGLIPIYLGRSGRRVKTTFADGKLQSLSVWDSDGPGDTLRIGYSRRSKAYELPVAHRRHSDLRKGIDDHADYTQKDKMAEIVQDGLSYIPQSLPSQNAPPTPARVL